MSNVTRYSRISAILVHKNRRVENVRRFVFCAFSNQNVIIFSSSSSNELLVRVDLSRYKDDLIGELEKLGKDSKFESTEYINVNELAVNMMTACRKPKAVSEEQLVVC